MAALLDINGIPLPPKKTAADGASSDAAIHGGFIIDATEENFETEVLIASKHTPVIVDMWSPRCGPCKQLMPLLEKVITSYNGAVKLVKINADENPRIAGLLRVQSLPTVLAFFNGQPIDGFMGFIPEPAIRQFTDNVLNIAGVEIRRDIRPILEAADKARHEKRLPDAENLYWQVLEADAGNTQALAGLGHCYLDNGDIGGAREYLKSLSPELYEIEEIKNFRNRIKLTEKAGNDTDLHKLEQIIAKNPADHASRLVLAEKYIAHNNPEAAFDCLLDSVAINPKWEDGKAKAVLLELFNSVGHTHPATAAARRKLSGILFR